MPRPQARREIEIKLAVGDAAAGRRLLRQSGFRLHQRRVLEANTVFDTPQHTLYRAGALLRVRRLRQRGVLTYKGPAAIGKYKSREELELELQDPQIMHGILTRLGFQPVFRYEKFRAEYHQSDGPGLVMLDETPIGVFLELEGPPRWIDRTARRMGFSLADYITASYRTLYLDFCKKKGIRPGDMVFGR